MRRGVTQTESYGFTLIELLVVLFILSTLMAVALPVYLGSVKESARRACRGNMQSIANAGHAWKVRTLSRNYSAMTLTDLTPDLGALPLCPDGGTYSIVHSGTVKDALGSTISVPSDSFGIKCDYNTDEHGGVIPSLTRE